MIRTCSVFFYEMIIQVWPHEETQEKRAHTHTKSHTERGHCIQCRVTREGLGEEAEGRSKGKAAATGFIGASKGRKSKEGEQFRIGNLNNFRGL